VVLSYSYLISPTGIDFASFAILCNWEVKYRIKLEYTPTFSAKPSLIIRPCDNCVEGIPYAL
jgi:hypothetical protein